MAGLGVTSKAAFRIEGGATSGTGLVNSAYPTTEATADSEEQYVAAALDYSKIVPILIAECQFLRQRVAALEAA